MSISKTLFTAAGTLALATAACAQDVTYDEKTEVLDSTAIDGFTLADANADGGLDRAEYQTYVETLAGTGDEDAAAMAETGDYDVQFMTKDANADGLVDISELAPVAEPAIEEPMIEDSGVEGSMDEDYNETGE